MSVRWWPDAALTVVLAAKGYPGAYETGSAIGGLEAGRARCPAWRSSMPAPGATAIASSAHGGRVLNVTARGSSLAEAQARAYQAIGSSTGRTGSAAATSAGAQ
jgi:phosphoribosylamine---glycine ligase